MIMIFFLLGKESASAKLNFLLIRQTTLHVFSISNEWRREVFKVRHKRERERERERGKMKKILNRERRKEIKKEKRKKEKNMKCERKSCAFFNEMEIFAAKFKN